jgi:hypothetical protein
MTIFILNGFVYCEETAEKIAVNEVNTALSNFYKEDVKLTENNLKEFSGDLEALCFGFNSNDDSIYKEEDY